MAVEGSDEVFTKWLTKKLKSLDVEDEVLASYISGIVTTDDVETDKRDILKDILQDLVQSVDTEVLCDEILEEWAHCQEKFIGAQVIEQGRGLDLSERVSLIVGQSVQPVVKPSNRSEEEEKIREAILASCNYVSDEEEECESEEGASSSNPPKNQNTECVAAAEKAKRDKMKAESQEKKAQDKVNKEKQKAKQEERREKERKRTQKGERRR